MNYQSRLVWVYVDDLPKMARAGIGFCVNTVGWDTDFAVVQLYTNSHIPELDTAEIEWQYPTPNPGGSFLGGKKHE